VTDEPQPQSEASPTSRASLAPIGGVVALAGFALLAVEVIRTLTGGVLGTIATVLLWVGVGLLAVGLLLLVLSLAGGDDDMPAWGAQPLTDASAAAAPAPVTPTTSSHSPGAVPAPAPTPAPATPSESPSESEAPSADGG
jgi:hypothetical protein